MAQHGKHTVTQATGQNAADGRRYLKRSSAVAIFAVTAVYANGQESQPASATLTVTGIEGLLITGHGQLPADIYTTDGRLVRRQATTLSGLKGIYIINGKKTVIN